MSERKRAAGSRVPACGGLSAKRAEGPPTLASQAFAEQTLAEGEFISPEHFKSQGVPGRAAGPFGEMKASNRILLLSGLKISKVIFGDKPGVRPPSGGHSPKPAEGWPTGGEEEL